MFSNRVPETVKGKNRKKNFRFNRNPKSWLLCVISFVCQPVAGRSLKVYLARLNINNNSNLFVRLKSPTILFALLAVQTTAVKWN
jgi:hypothetical protein